MEEKEFADKNILEQVREYVSTRIELIRIEFIEKSSAIISKIIIAILLAAMSFIIIILISIGLSYYVGEKVGSMLGGFSIVAGGYLLLLFILVLIRKKAIEAPLINYQIGKNFKNKVK